MLYFAWFGFFGTKSYRFTCRLLSAGSAYCIYLIVTNRRFLQSIKYPAQCNRALHQLRMRFEATPMHAPNAFMVASAVSAATSTDGSALLAASPGTSDAGIGLSKPAISPPHSASSTSDAPSARPPSFMTESQLSFFPTVPRQLRDGFMEFKATYYRKIDAAKRRTQERQRRDKRQRPSVTTPVSKSAKRRNPTDQHDPCHDGSPQGSPLSTNASAAYSNGLGLASFLSGADSATDDSSTTTSSVLTRRPTSRDRGRHTGSGLAYSLSEHVSSSEDESHAAPIAL
ncbi:hypothetical protein LPJ60_000331 [Coemansia sp. RSA 2675]|nr:hypothetical protein LPJ60_000331 [Coemansia sp. RSA 2675]